jgi:flagellar export protein FliJ
MKWKGKMRKINTISKILKLKDGKKQEIELEVKEAADRVEEEKSKLKSLERDYREKFKAFSEKNSEGNLDINKINSFYDYFASIDEKIKEQKEVHMKCKQELRDLQNILVHAHQDKKMFEILKEKAVKEQRKEQALSEQKEAEYFVLTRKLR